MEHTLQSRRVCQVPTLDVRFRRADHDIPDITRFLYEPQVSRLYGSSARAVGVADNHYKIGIQLCEGVVSKELKELLIELRRASARVANVDFYGDTRLIC